LNRVTKLIFSSKNNYCKKFKTITHFVMLALLNP
jgi:hypothetical protein